MKFIFFSDYFLISCHEDSFIRTDSLLLIHKLLHLFLHHFLYIELLIRLIVLIINGIVSFSWLINLRFLKEILLKRLITFRLRFTILDFFLRRKLFKRINIFLFNCIFRIALLVIEDFRLLIIIFKCLIV